MRVGKGLIAIAGIFLMSCQSGVESQCVLGEAKTPAEVMQKVAECEPKTTYDIRLEVVGLLEHYLADDLVISKSDLQEIEKRFAVARRSIR